jgi:hypothetical protein
MIVGPSIAAVVEIEIEIETEKAPAVERLGLWITRCNRGG